MQKSRIRVVSKPLDPPWNDSSKNLARTLVQYAHGREFVVTSNTGGAWDAARVEVIASTNACDFKPSAWTRLSLFLRLCMPDPQTKIYHFFFAPNKWACLFLKIICRLKKKKTVHTLCSRPKDFGSLKRMLFADRVVAVSGDMLSRLEEAGVEGTSFIPPCVSPRDPESISTGDWDYLRKEGEVLALYPGDLEFSGAHETLARIIPEVLAKNERVKFVLACRPKTAQARDYANALKLNFEQAGVTGRVVFLGEIKSMSSLIRACDFVFFPVKSLYGKMDTPLVLLEAMQLERAVASSDLPPLKELVDSTVGSDLAPDDSSGWVKVLCDWANDPDCRERLGKAGAKRVSERFLPQDAAGAYESLYDSLEAVSKTADKNKYYDAFSRTYEHGRRQGYHALIDDLESDFVLRYGRSKDILEVGCGTGLIMERLKTHVRSVRGIDPSVGMLNKAREKGLDVSLGSAEALPFKDESFDVTFSYKVLAHVENIHEALQEMERVTRPGGIVIAEFYNRASVRGLRWQARKAALALGKKKDGITEKDIFTRYDGPAQMQTYASERLRLCARRGIVIWTPLAVAHRVPLLGNALRFIERRSADTFLSRFGGFLALAFQKKP